MASSTLTGAGRDPAIQFSVFVPNKLGRIHDLSSLFKQHGVHILGLTVLDTTDSAILRLVVDDPDRARTLLHERGFPFTEAPILVVEVDADSRLSTILAALLEAEINIHYIYAFITVHAGRPLLALNLEYPELAAETLARHQIQVLNQSDLSR